jgi:glycosyltransferase involved in cell wall biosynthesis
MKILICTESFYPNISGVAVFTRNLAQKMAKRGHSVTLIAPSPKYTPYQEILEGVRIQRLPSKKNKYREGYFISKSPFLRVSKIIEEFRPDVIHLQDPAGICFATLRKARKLKIPVVVTNHFSLEYIVSYLSPFFKTFQSLILFVIARYLNWFYNQCQVLTCPTQTVAKRFKGPITKVRLEVISNGVDLSRFMPYYGDISSLKRKWQIPLKRKVILFIGRLDVDKEVETLINAIPKVIKKIDAHLVIIGGGKEKENLIQRVKDYQLTSRVTFIDFIPYEDKILPKAYQMAEVFVNPCPHETQSIVTLEAQATGLPVVVANSGALPELVKNEINGLCFRPGDDQDLAAKIIKVLTNKTLAKKMGQKGLEMIEEHLVNDTYKKYEEIYQKLAKV